MGLASPKGRSSDRAVESGQARESARLDRARATDAPAPDPLRPVFLHSLWRSGSTYVWSRFRTAEGALCYYEPLHDGLRRLTSARIRRDTPDAIQANHHPVMTEPYFAEFAPLVAGRGVAGYRRRFAYERFALAETDQDPALEAYIRKLIDHAQGQNRSPVLGFNRTGLRVGWLKRRFDACNIHIDRDPIDVFSSYLSQVQEGNYYYFVKWMQILAANADYPLFARALTRFARPDRVQSLFVNPKKFYRGEVDAASIETLYSITFLAWAVCALHALTHSDIMLDIALADRPGYGEGLAEAVRAQTGLAVSFEDMHAPSPPSPLRLARQRAIERQVLADIAALAPVDLLDRTMIRARLGELSPRRADLLARVV